MARTEQTLRARHSPRGQRSGLQRLGSSRALGIALAHLPEPRSQPLYLIFQIFHIHEHLGTHCMRRPSGDDVRQPPLQLPKSLLFFHGQHLNSFSRLLLITNSLRWGLTKIPPYRILG